MDEAVEKQAFRQLARGAAEMDIRLTRPAAKRNARLTEKQTPLYGEFLKGFETGTAPSAVFSEAYQGLWEEMAQQTQRQGR